MNSNPVVEAFADAYASLEEERKAEAEWEAEFARQVEKAPLAPSPFGIFTQQMFDLALRQATTMPGITLHDLPEPPKRFRKRKQ